MKANEVPEKLYYAPYGDIREDYPITDNDIEYTRTDAFIEKAAEWLKHSLDNGCWIANDVGKQEKDAIIEHFKETMKLKE